LYGPPKEAAHLLLVFSLACVISDLARELEHLSFQRRHGLLSHHASSTNQAIHHMSDRSTAESAGESPLARSRGSIGDRSMPSSVPRLGFC
jgi:hypothetical protein